MSDIMTVGIAAIDSNSKESSLGESGVREAAKSLDKVFLSMFLERAWKSEGIGDEDPALQSFVSKMHVDIISQHIVDSGGILTNAIEKQLSVQHYNEASLRAKG